MWVCGSNWVNRMAQDSRFSPRYHPLSAAIWISGHIYCKIFPNQSNIIVRKRPLDILWKYTIRTYNLKATTQKQQFYALSLKIEFFLSQKDDAYIICAMISRRRMNRIGKPGRWCTTGRSQRNWDGRGHLGGLVWGAWGGHVGGGAPALAPRTPGCLMWVRVTRERYSTNISSVLG